MNKTELANKLAEKTDLSKTKALEVLTSLVDVVTEELVAGNEVSVSGLGKFSTRKSEAREGRNPQTGEKIKISERRNVKFAVSKPLKEAVL